MKNVYLIIISVLILSSLATTAPADEPLELVQSKLGKVIDLLYVAGESDPENAEIERKQQVRDIIYAAFDFEKLSERALSRDKSKLNEDQFVSFVRLFADVLFNTYYDRIRDYKVDSIDYKGEQFFNEGEVAEVRTVVKSGQSAYPIDYRLLKKDGEWLVYDVIVEGVSLVKNYRSQFSGILRSDSPSKLISMLEKKVAGYGDKKNKKEKE